MISLSAPMNSHLQCAAQKILLFIANEPISQATNMFCQLQSLIPLSFVHRLFHQTLPIPRERKINASPVKGIRYA